MGEEMTILAMIFGATVGAGIMAGFNIRSYDKGYADGQKIIHIHREEVPK